VKKSAVEQSEILICEECGETVYTCECGEYFVPGSICWCDEYANGNVHLCDSCAEEKNERATKEDSGLSS
jgi:hypothetical protein